MNADLYATRRVGETLIVDVLSGESTKNLRPSAFISSTVLTLPS